MAVMTRANHEGPRLSVPVHQESRFFIDILRHEIYIETRGLTALQTHCGSSDTEDPQITAL